MYAKGHALHRAYKATRITSSDLLVWRYKHDLSQQQLADILGLDRKSISRWECNGRTIPLWLDMALKGVEQYVKRG